MSEPKQTLPSVVGVTGNVSTSRLPDVAAGGPVTVLRKHPAERTAGVITCIACRPWQNA